jgi:hypothetical protein
MPGLIHALTVGFETVANHIGLILIPAALDLFLWLGPRLSVFEVLNSIFKQIDQMAPSLQAGSSGQFPPELLQNFNLFSAAHTFPVGIFSLISYATLTHSPFGAVSEIQVGSGIGVFLWLIAITFAGWIIGGLYFFWVARVALQDQRPWFAGLFRSLLQTTILSFALITTLIVLSIPGLLLLAAISFINPQLGQIAAFILLMIVLWIMVPAFFSAHGIFVLGLNAFRSIIASLNLLSATMGRLGGFVLAALIIQIGLGYLWMIPPDTSWMLLVGILGNAFISTALLAASFIYYKELSAWLQAVMEKLKTQTTSVRA